MTQITTYTIADYLKNNVDWGRFYSMIDTIGNTMNGPKDRFYKSDLVEMGLAAYCTDGRIEYVNEEGADFYIHFESQKISLEMKYSTGSLFSISKKNSRPVRVNDKVKSLRLVNTQGNNERTSLPVNYADFLLIGDLYGAAVVDKKTLSENLKFNNGSIDTHPISHDKVAWVINTIKTPVVRKVIENFDYKKSLFDFQQKFLKMF